MARVDRQAVLAEYEAERLRCNNLLERPAGDMRRPTRVFETAQREADEDAALVERTQRIRDVSATDLGRYAALYAELVRGIRRGRSRALEPAPDTEADEVALVERTRRIRTWWGGMQWVTPRPRPTAHREEAPVGMQWVENAPHEVDYEDAVTGTVDYKKAVSKDSTIEEMWAKMESLGIMRD